jgi:hypothetical protein
MKLLILWCCETRMSRNMLLYFAAITIVCLSTLPSPGHIGTRRRTRCRSAHCLFNECLRTAPRLLTAFSSVNSRTRCHSHLSCEYGVPSRPRVAPDHSSRVFGVARKAEVCRADYVSRSASLARLTALGRRNCVALGYADINLSGNNPRLRRLSGFSDGQQLGSVKSTMSSLPQGCRTAVPLNYSSLGHSPRATPKEPVSMPKSCRKT